MAEFLPAKRDKRVEVTLPRYHLVCDNGDKEQDDACNIAPELKQCSQYQVDQPEKLDGVAKFIAGMRVIGDGDKSHVQHDLRIEPPALDGEFAKYQRRHDT